MMVERKEAGYRKEGTMIGRKRREETNDRSIERVKERTE